MMSNLVRYYKKVLVNLVFTAKLKVTKNQSFEARDLPFAGETLWKISELVYNRLKYFL